MFQISAREKGKCFLSVIGCSGEEVVTVTKQGEQPLKACKRHLWEILANGQKKPKKAKKNTEVK